ALAADLRDVVPQAGVGRPVVLREQDAPGPQHLREVCRRRGGPEGLVVALVLQVDDEHVANRRGWAAPLLTARARGRVARGRGGGGGGGGGDDGRADAHAWGLHPCAGGRSRSSRQCESS